MQKASLHIVLDVDGTLEGFGGSVTSELCRKLRQKGARLWMLSKRDTDREAHEIMDIFHLEEVVVHGGIDYVDIKTKTLLALKDRLAATLIVYVGDRIEDMIVAFKADVVYCSDTTLTLDIFEEVKNPHIRAIL